MKKDNEVVPEKKDYILDINGFSTGFIPNKRSVIYLVVAAALLLICPLCSSAIGLPDMKSGLMLGLTLACVILWLSNLFNIAFPLLFFIGFGFASGLFAFADLQAVLGKSQLLMMFGMFVVAQGAEQTPIAKRVAYFFLYKFGKNQGRMLLAIFLASLIMSVFCSNLASTVIMAAICIGVCTELEKVDPNSRHTMGKATMLMIPVGAMTGGMCLISSSPALNALGVSTLQAASGGAAVLSYNNWASIGIPSALIVAIPTWYIYKKVFKVPSSGASVEPSYFKNKLNELGPIGGSEIRWIIIVLSMVAAMIAGVSSGVAAIVAAVIAICPFIGCMNSGKAIRSLPMDVFSIIGFASIMATGFTKYGIGDWLSGFMSPMLSKLPPFVLMLFCGLTMGISNGIFVNAVFGIVVILITVFTPIVMSMGLNPAIILFPCILMGACNIILGVQTNMFLTYKYGYWEIKDPIIPGILTNIVWVLTVSLVAYFVGPLVGIPLYL